MKVTIRKTEYPRKAPCFSVWVTDDDGVELFCALPQTYECTARVVAAAMASLIKTGAGRELVLEGACCLGSRGQEAA
jgi:hypothetical protein